MMIICILLGLLPMAFYAAVLWWLDHWEREPAWLTVSVFLWGAAPAFFFALLLQVLAHTSLFASFDSAESAARGMLLTMVVAAPVTEEVLKAIPLLAILLFHREEIDSWFDGVVYGAITGFGFAAVENVFYFLATVGRGGNIADLTGLVVARALAFGPLHAVFTSLAGIGFVAARLQRSGLTRVGFACAGLSASIAIHLLHNLAASIGGSLLFVSLFTQWSGVIALLVLLSLSLVQQRLLIMHYLQPEVAIGTLTASQAHMALMPRRLALRSILPSPGICSLAGRHRRLTTFAAEYAFAMHHRDKFGARPGDDAHIAELRNQMLQCSREQRST